jgi:hypothetical protein
LIHIERRGTEEILRATLTRLNDCSDVLTACSVAAKLLIEQIEIIEADVMEIARLAGNKEM